MSSALTAAHASGDDRMQLVDEPPNAPLAGLHFRQERLEALLKFAAVLGTRSQRTPLEGINGFCL